VPDAMGWDRWLGFLGRLLPARIRERVFEPACYDLASETLRGHRSTRLLGPKIFAILVYVATANFPGVLFENRRPSRLGVLMGSLALLSFAFLLGLRIVLGDRYAGP